MSTRRTFLRQSASAVVAMALTAPPPLRRLIRRRAPQRVLVLGAGAAGLAAAWELSRMGHEVLVFEAKAYPGGRIHTLRAPFADGLYAEAGALYLSSNDLATAYAREFDLPLVQVALARADLGSIAHIAGTRVEMIPGNLVQWPIELNDDERGLHVRELQSRYHYAPLLALENLSEADWPRPDHLHLDIPLADFWRRNGASEGAVRIMRSRYFDLYGDGIESVSTLQLARELLFIRGSQAAYHVRGGNDLLPRAFSERLGAMVRYGAPVTAIRQDADSVEITVEGRGGRQQVRGDQLLTTLPFQALRGIEVTPAFPERRRRAIREIQPTSVTRTYLQCRSRFWEAEGQDGSAITDLPIQQVYHSTAAQDGIRGILESYTCGERARRLGVMSPDERLGTVIAEMAKVHPRLPAHVEGGTSYSWDRDPWSRGDAAHFQAGQIRAFFPWLREPEGRIHFAGDTIGGFPGYIDSAMRSARAAVEAIDRLP